LGSTERRARAGRGGQVVHRGGPPRPGRARGPRRGRLGEVVDGHARTSSFGPATTTPAARSAGVAGRRWPRSVTYASDGSASFGALTNDENRRSFSGSSRTAFHSSS